MVDDYLWLPDHHQHVLYSLAHADALIARTAGILHTYTKQGALVLEDVVDGSTMRLTVRGVAPMPQAVARSAGDALNQLRSALEHVVYAEVAHQIQRPLTPREARSIEMPAAAGADDFRAWLQRRSSLAPLQPGAALAERIGDLQPFHRREPTEHPLRILVEHTNWAKHRTPAVAATLVGTIIPAEPVEGVIVSAGGERPVEVGDVLASAPVGTVVPLDIWPKVSIQRPHNQVWVILLHELRDLEQWVRTTALPLLIAGTTDVTPLPPHLDITLGYPDLQAALTAAHPMPAAERAQHNVQVDLARDGLSRIIALQPAAADRATIDRWVATLSGEEVLHTVQSLHTADSRQLAALIRRVRREARAVEER